MDPEVLALVRDELDWLTKHDVEPFIGRGKYGPLHVRIRDRDGNLTRGVSTGTGGSVMIDYSVLQRTAPLDDPDVRLEVNRRLNLIPGVSIPERMARYASWPTIPQHTLSKPEARTQLFDVLDWIARLLSGSGDRPD